MDCNRFSKLILYFITNFFYLFQSMLMLTQLHRIFLAHVFSLFCVVLVSKIGERFIIHLLEEQNAEKCEFFRVIFAMKSLKIHYWFIVLYLRFCNRIWFSRSPSPFSSVSTVRMKYRAREARSETYRIVVKVTRRVASAWSNCLRTFKSARIFVYICFRQ